MGKFLGVSWSFWITLLVALFFLVLLLVVALLLVIYFSIGADEAQDGIDESTFIVKQVEMIKPFDLGFSLRTVSIIGNPTDYDIKVLPIEAKEIFNGEFVAETILPEVEIPSNDEIEKETIQFLRINQENRQGFSDFIKALIQDESVQFELVGDSALIASVGAFDICYSKLGFSKDPSIKALNGLEDSVEIATVTVVDATNTSLLLITEHLVENPSDVALRQIGPLTLFLYVEGSEVGTIFFDDFTLDIGLNRYLLPTELSITPENAEIFQLFLSSYLNGDTNVITIKGKEESTDIWYLKEGVATLDIQATLVGSNVDLIINITLDLQSLASLPFVAVSLAIFNPFEDSLTISVIQNVSIFIREEEGKEKQEKQEEKVGDDKTSRDPNSKILIGSVGEAFLNETIPPLQDEIISNLTVQVENVEILLPILQNVCRSGETEPKISVEITSILNGFVGEIFPFRLEYEQDSVDVFLKNCEILQNETK